MLVLGTGLASIGSQILVNIIHCSWPVANRIFGEGHSDQLVDQEPIFARGQSVVFAPAGSMAMYGSM